MPLIKIYGSVFVCSMELNGEIIDLVPNASDMKCMKLGSPERMEILNCIDKQNKVRPLLYMLAAGFVPLETLHEWTSDPVRLQMMKNRDKESNQNIEEIFEGIMTDILENYA